MCVNVDRAHVTSACCYLEITARKCRSFEEEEKVIEFGASVKKKLSSMRGLPFPSLREVVVVSWWFPCPWSLVGSHLPARGKNKKICACASSSEHHTHVLCSCCIVRL